MDARFWFRIRIAGWLILLFWYSLYMTNTVSPIFGNSVVFVSHGITGIVGTILILTGYFKLEKHIFKDLKKQTQK